MFLNSWVCENPRRISPGFTLLRVHLKDRSHHIQTVAYLHLPSDLSYNYVHVPLSVFFSLPLWTEKKNFFFSFSTVANERYKKGKIKKTKTDSKLLSHFLQRYFKTAQYTHKKNAKYGLFHHCTTLLRNPTTVTLVIFSSLVGNRDSHYSQ